jgi:predicted dehydrogenase
MSTIRFGVIGAGQIAQNSCKDIESHPNAELVAASDINGPRLQELSDKYGFSRTYADSADLIADPDIDALYIGVPNAFHAPLAKAGLEAGKHVILDKPFALNIVEAEGVAQAARQSGKTFMLGMNQRFRAESQIIRNLVHQGALGEVYHAKAFWFRRTGIPKLGTWFGKKKLAGGGALLDIGVHLLDLALYAVGNFKPVAVSGATYTKFGNRGLGEGGWGMSEATDMEFDVDDFATAMIKFEGGLTVTLDVSWAIHQADANRMNVHLFGTEAGAGLYPGELYRYGSEPGSYDIVEQPEGQVDYAHENRFHNFINALLGDEEPCVGIDESLAVQKILDGIYASCASGKEVRIQ